MFISQYHENQLIDTKREPLLLPNVPIRFCLTKLVIILVKPKFSNRTLENSN